VKTEEADLCDHRRVLGERTRKAGLDWARQSSQLSRFCWWILDSRVNCLTQRRVRHQPTTADISHQRFGWKPKRWQNSTSSQFTAVR